jgi:hypothetical protein
VNRMQAELRVSDRIIARIVPCIGYARIEDVCFEKESNSACPHTYEVVKRIRGDAFTKNMQAKKRGSTKFE